MAIFIFIRSEKFKKEKIEVEQNIRETLDKKSGVNPNNPDINKGLVGIKPDPNFNTKASIAILKEEADSWFRDYERVLKVFQGKTKPQLSAINRDLMANEGYSLNDIIFNEIFTRCKNFYGKYIGTGCEELQKIITIINT